MRKSVQCMCVCDLTVCPFVDPSVCGRFGVPACDRRERGGGAKGRHLFLGTIVDIGSPRIGPNRRHEPPAQLLRRRCCKRDAVESSDVSPTLCIQFSHPPHPPILGLDFELVTFGLHYAEPWLWRLSRYRPSQQAHHGQGRQQYHRTLCQCRRHHRENTQL
jgi:hypothetical protein